MNSIDKLRHTFQAARSARENSSLAQVAEQYDEYLLELTTVPDEAWSLFTGIFTDDAMLKRRGLERFLMEMNVDLPKYSGRQLQEILGILIDNVHRMDHEIARHAAGDFIARAYPPDIALKALRTLAQGQPRDKHVALAGLEVLQHRADRELSPSIRATYEELLASSDDWYRRI